MYTRRYIPLAFHNLPAVSGFGSKGRLIEVDISRKLYDGDIVNSVRQRYVIPPAIACRPSCRIRTQQGSLDSLLSHDVSPKKAVTCL
jgi:hypothetical protein